MKISYFLALFLIVNCIVDENFLQNEFSSFMKAYNKSYSDKNEERERFNFFKKNYEKYGNIHSFSDTPDREQALEYLARTKKIPQSFSYYSNLGVPKNQGNCKFCFVFSYISLIEAQYSIKYGKKYRLSEQEILDCSGDQIICDEGFNFAKLDFYIRNRLYLTFENKYPYTGIKNPLNCQKISKNEDKYSSTIKLKVDQLETKPILTYKYPKNCLKSLLIKRGPLGTKIHYSLIDNYKGGIISTYQDNCDKNGNDNHAVTIIGYDYDANTKKHYWIIRNSYGTEWGEGGYFRVEAGSNICGIEENAYHFNLNWDSWCGEGCDQCDYNTQENKLICSSCIKGY